jgi:hypothetical protein
VVRDAPALDGAGARPAAEEESPRDLVGWVAGIGAGEGRPGQGFLDPADLVPDGPVARALEEDAVLGKEHREVAVGGMEQVGIAVCLSEIEHPLGVAAALPAEALEHREGLEACDELGALVALGRDQDVWELDGVGGGVGLWGGGEEEGGCGAF